MTDFLKDYHLPSNFYHLHHDQAKQFSRKPSSGIPAPQWYVELVESCFQSLHAEPMLRDSGFIQMLREVEWLVNMIMEYSEQ